MRSVCGYVVLVLFFLSWTSCAMASTKKPFPAIWDFERPLLPRMGAELGLISLRYPQNYFATTSVSEDRFGRFTMAASSFFNVPGLNYNRIVFSSFRYLPTGQPDVSYGKNGEAVASFLPLGPSYFASDCVLDPSGRTLVSGYAGSGDDVDLVLALFDENGRPDPSFHGTGYSFVDFDFGSNDLAAGAKFDSKGRILVALSYGHKTQFDIGVARVLPDGSPDPEFGVFGVSSIGYGDHQNFAQRLLLQKDGKIIVLGFTQEGKALLARFNENGTPDVSFGVGGITLVPLQGEGSRVFRADVGPDGKIVLVGVMEGAPSRTLIVRLNSDGTIDESFGTKGSLAINFFLDLDSTGASISILDDGRLLIGGQIFTGQDDNGLTLMQLMPNGEFDSSFGYGSGRVIVKMPGPTQIKNIGRLAGDRILTVTDVQGTGTFRITRHEANGKLVGD